MNKILILTESKTKRSCAWYLFRLAHLSSIFLTSFKALNNHEDFSRGGGGACARVCSHACGSMCAQVKSQTQASETYLTGTAIPGSAKLTGRWALGPSSLYLLSARLTSTRHRVHLFTQVLKIKLRSFATGTLPTKLRPRSFRLQFLTLGTGEMCRG